MIRALIAALALCLAAVPAFAQRAPAAPFVSYTDAFDRFATGTVTMPPAERVRAFRAEFNALVPGFFEPRNGATEEKYDARVLAALQAYPAQRDAFLAAARDFAAVYATANTRFRRFFPDYAPAMPIYLVHSLGEMDGGTRELNGKLVAIFGADVIARIHSDDTIGPFLDHELFHFHHARFFPECEALWCALWAEGLATYVAAKMNPGADDRGLLLSEPRPIRPAVDPRFAEAMCLTRTRFDSTDRRDLALFFSTDKRDEKDFPPRFGYYVGYRLAEKIGEGRSLQQLATATPQQVRPMLLAAIEDFGACPQ